MISKQDLIPIGYFNKPHGIKGEISATIAEYDPDGLEFIFVEIDGLFVPFRIEALRTKGVETYLLSIKGIPGEYEASLLTGKKIWAESSLFEGNESDGEDGFYMSDLIGYSILADGECIGIVCDYDDSTENTLFVVESKNKAQLLVPANPDLIGDIDPDNKTIEMYLPDGILDL